MTGFVQAGVTRFGFRNGIKDFSMRYGIIRTLWYAPGRADVGIRLIREAQAYCGSFGVALEHAFFHYFGMSCYARHGKLHESLFYMEEALRACGMRKEHENVYFSLPLGGETRQNPSGLELAGGKMTAGGERAYVFIRNGERVGDCVVHDLPQGNIAYLRWMGVDGRFRHQGIGSRCMGALCHALNERGVTRLDTDTIDSNAVAQRFYRRMGFVRRGVTRDYVAVRE